MEINEKFGQYRGSISNRELERRKEMEKLEQVSQRAAENLMKLRMDIKKELTNP